MARRFRPRFSLRTLAVFVTLVCAYFAAWGPTKRHAEQIMSTQGDIIKGGKWITMGDELMPLEVVEIATSPLPLVIRQDEMDNDWTKKRRYYLWLLGPTIKLPFESTLEDQLTVYWGDVVSVTVDVAP